MQKKISDNQVTLESVTLTKSGDNYVAEGLGVGEYIVIATNTDTVVYNPMIVSVYYDVNGVHAGTVSATDNWKITGSTTVAKSAEPRIDKTIPAASSTGKMVMMQLLVTRSNTRLRQIFLPILISTTQIH